MIKVLFSAREGLWPVWAPHLTRAFAEAGLEVDLTTDNRPEEVDYILFAPNPSLRDFTPFIRCKAVLSLWAGVETIVGNATLTQPLARMVDPGLTEGMVEYVVGHVLRHHLGMDAHIHGLDGRWDVRQVPPLARHRRVGILGLGALGAAAATALAGLNFDVAGWSRRPKELPGITGFSGEDGLREILTRSEIVVLLLPLTEGTHHLLDAKRLGHLPKGAVVINPGRGPLIDDAALLAAIETGQVGHATLDTFAEEPLPPTHPFWSNPAVTVTPHIASETRPATAAESVASNIRDHEAGAPLRHLVDRAAGY